MYKRRPSGEYLVSVCTNTLCNVMGGQDVYDGLVEHLGVGHDETTGDGKITLEHAECLAACDYAPVVTVNYDFAIDQATPDSAVALVEQLRSGERPMPARGARLCSLKETAMQLAGFPDGRDGVLADGPAGAPTLRGVTLAQEHGIAVADFNIDTPIAKTKPAREEKPGPVKTAASPAKARQDVKDPQVRTAETRNVTASTPGTPPATGTAAESAGTGANKPASDGKPAGDARPAVADEEKK
jgi:NADH-quinone oxidoreductase subunit E